MTGIRLFLMILRPLIWFVYRHSWHGIVICVAILWSSPLSDIASGQSTSRSKDDRAPTPGLNEQQIEAGWLSLFDGETLYGWRAETDANWQVTNGQILVDQGELGLLRTTTQFDDFELELEFRADTRTNSGIFFRTSPNPTDPTLDCYELNIAHPLDSGFPTGSLVGRAAFSNELDVSDWTPIRIVAEGPSVRCWIRDQLTIDYADPRPGGPLGRGFIGLQYNSGAVAFRNIRIRPSSLPPIPLNERLDGWKTELTQASQFSVQDEILRISGGPGQLETQATFADFICRLSCRTNAVGLNSGVFFRAIPGELMNGYESQIHNLFQQDDRTLPLDCGTGGIFRRQNARFVNSDDLQWFHKTIIAVGPRISVWVNGYQVSDWTDPRPAHPNPRSGRRLEAGSLILQGHDPTTDILFKEIRVREMEPRRR
jgi:hypothetical protein